MPAVFVNEKCVLKKDDYRLKNAHDGAHAQHCCGFWRGATSFSYEAANIQQDFANLQIIIVGDLKINGATI